MNGVPPFLQEPEGTREEILKATYLALCKHGYSDLTIQRISDEFPKSKSLLYHHYDGKDDLLRDFLEFMLDRMDGLPPLTGDTAEDHIESIVEETFPPADVADDDHFAQALVELRAQAAHDEQYREYFTRADRFIRKQVEHIIRSGIEEGVFQEVDPRETAALFVITFTGTLTQRVTSNDAGLEESRAEFERYVRELLLADDPEKE